MINKTIFKLEIETDTQLIIKVNGKIKKKISVNNKTINTSEIYKMLNYKNGNKYILDNKKFEEKETKGKDNEVKRLYNYVYDLLDEIIKAVNDIKD